MKMKPMITMVTKQMDMRFRNGRDGQKYCRAPYMAALIAIPSQPKIRGHFGTKKPKRNTQRAPGLRYPWNS